MYIYICIFLRKLVVIANIYGFCLEDFLYHRSHGEEKEREERNARKKKKTKLGNKEKKENKEETTKNLQGGQHNKVLTYIKLEVWLFEPQI